MRRRLLLPLVLLAAVPAPAARAAERTPADQGARIARLVQGLSRDTQWRLTGQVALQARTYHPEGLVRRDGRWIVSAVEVTQPTVKFPDGPRDDGTDRSEGAGVGHLLAFGDDGKLLRDQVLGGSTAAEYHPGGLDDDGRHLWVTMAQYRPASSTTVLRVDPASLKPTALFRAGDHYGGVVHDPATGRLVTLNWGARQAATWKLPRRPALGRVTRPLSLVPNPSHFVDYQDCKALGRVPGRKHPLMLCGGITQYGAFQLGGIALVDTVTMVPVHEVPITTLTPAGNVLTRNPIDVDVTGGRLRIHVAPDDEATTIFTYEALG